MSEPLQLVAITDPNDMLSYRIRKQAVQGSDVTLRNVLVSNAPTVLGTFADPIRTHVDRTGPQVFDLIVNGHP